MDVGLGDSVGCRWMILVGASEVWKPTSVGGNASSGMVVAGWLLNLWKERVLNCLLSNQSHANKPAVLQFVAISSSPPKKRTVA